MTRTKKPDRPPLSHVEERLAERALPAAAERGFALLRNRERLAAMIENLSGLYPEIADAPRIALALGPGAAPARLIVTRDGVGVTCLAAGMASTAPELPWLAVDVFLEREARLFRAQMEAQRNRGAPHGTPLGRALSFPWRLVRSEVSALETLAPLFGDLAKRNVIFALDAIAELRTKPVILDEAACADFWRLYTGAAAWLMACRREREVMSLAYAVVMHANDVHLVARAMWVLLSDPDRLLDCSADIVQGRDLVAGFICRYVLPALALRHPARAKDAARYARMLLEEHPVADVEAVPNIIRSLEDGATQLPPMLDAYAPHLAGIDLAGWRPLDEIGTPPRLTPRAPAALDDDTRASLAAWRRLLHGRSLPALITDDTTFPAIVALTPLEALLPEDEPDPMWRRSEGIAYVKGTLKKMVRVTSLKAPERAPVRREKTPGRNDPCPCGSGRKYKQCHGKA